MGCTAFLLANRLIPPGMEGRADMEIDAMFAVWGVSALVALAVPRRKAWTTLLGATAVGLLAIPIYDALLLDPGLFHWIAQADWALVMVDATLLIFAIGFALTARMVARHRPKRKVRRERIRVAGQLAAEPA